MLNSTDLAQMQADLQEVIGDHPQSIVIRRGNDTLAAQTVRVERTGTGRGNNAQSPTAKEAQARITVAGDVNLDIQIGDRFNALGFLYEVVALRPNSQIGVMAEAEIKQ